MDHPHHDGPSLSVIIPIRNRSGVRLENCLRSLRWQQGIAPDDYEILLSDYGSDPEHFDSIRELAERYDARLIRAETDAIWNRSHVLNIGIRAARGRYTFCTDADMLFQDNFLSTLLEHHADPTRAALLVCRCHDLPESVPEQLWEREDFDTLRDQATVRTTSGTGACQCARTGFFHAVRGYDEGFKYWGAEDDDMRHRAMEFGLELVWVHDQTSMLHQWHPTLKNDRRDLFWINRVRHWTTRRIVYKNWRGWGQMP